MREQLASGGSALPWRDSVAFLRHAVALAKADRAGSAGTLTFFDRGLLDAAIGLEHLTGESAASLLADCARYDPLVFLTPPWPEIYVTDAERGHGLEVAVAEYERLLIGLPQLGYEISLVPKRPVSVRADFMLSALDEPTRE